MATRMQFGIGAGGVGSGVQANVERLALIEELGYDLAICGDTQMLGPDMLVSMTATVLNTKRVRITSMVSNPVTRHPSVTASGLAALQALSGGRVCFGIGTGDSSLINIGLKPATVAQFAEYCRAVKGLCTGEEVEYQGQRFRFHWATQPVPIWFAAEGPRMMRLAGEMADGVIFGNGYSEEVVKDSIRRVREAAVAAGRDPEAIECWWLVKPYFTDAPEEVAWREVAWTLAASAHHAFKFTLEDKFIPDHLREGVRRLMQGYRSSEHNRPEHGAHNASLVTENGLTEFLGRRFLMPGTDERIAARIRELRSWGATNLILIALWGDPVANTHRLAEIVAAVRDG
jgi:5,10-methylenetetrahydromethanopterin reductase